MVQGLTSQDVGDSEPRRHLCSVLGTVLSLVLSEGGGEKLREKIPGFAVCSLPACCPQTPGLAAVHGHISLPLLPNW